MSGREPTLHDVPEGDPIAAIVGGARPVVQILMQRLATVEGVEAALAPVYDALITRTAMEGFKWAAIDWCLRTPFKERNQLGLLSSCDRLGAMKRKVGREAVGPLAQAPDPVDPTVSGDAAWCARAIACMIADWGLADRPSDRDVAADELTRFLGEASTDLHYDRDADAIAAIDRARNRLEEWCATGE